MEERVNPGLEALLQRDPHARPVLLVYADWLEERGEPQGELIRLQLQAEAERLEPSAQPFSKTLREVTAADRAERLVAQHWARWFGALPRESVSLRWEHGFVHRLTLHQPLVDGGSWLGSPLLRLLHRMEGEGRLEGLDRLPRLAELQWTTTEGSQLAPLRGQLLPSLESAQLYLSGVPTGEDLRALAQTRWPRLRALRLHPIEAAQRGLLTALAQAPWREGLEALTVSVSAAAIGLLPGLGLGPRLTVRLPAPELVDHRARLRALIPEAILTPVPVTTASTESYGLGGPTASEAPRLAPANFRELPPWELQPGKGESTVAFGSGASFGEVGPALFSLCAGCGGEETRCVYLCTRSIYSERSFETTHFRTVEYLCAECGRFTSYQWSYDS